MRTILFFSCLVFVVCSLVLAQTREEKLQQLKSRTDIKVTEIEKDILKIEYPYGKVLIKNIGDYKRQPTNDYQQPITYSPTYDSTIIDLRYIDTTLYYYKYSLWQEVPLTNFDFDYLRIGDVNKNGKTELYGARKFFESETEPVCVYEFNESDGLFEFIYQYDSVYLIKNIYDIDNDSEEEVHFRAASGDQRFFSKENDTSLATQLNLILNYTPAQLDDQTLGDFDGDVYTDLLFDRWGKPYVYIFEYNPIVNNFDSVYRFNTQEPAPYDEGGYSVGDFDLDGKTDIVFGTGRGNVFVIENEGDNQYINSWQGSVESYHAYIHTPSNDINKNGKPEFWVLADAYYNGLGTTRLTIYETNGNNSYQAVGRVDLVGIFSFYAGTMQAVDIDNDGTEEIAVCIDQNFLILKFNGSKNHHTYEVYYIKQNELFAAGENSVYFGANVYDLLNNGEINILISMDHIIEQGGQFTSSRFTQIYKPDSTTSIGKDKLVPDAIKLYQNYPNPFNPITTIKFELNNTGSVTLKIYNILGKEIKLLLDDNLPAGEYNIQWNGKDDKGNIPPGGVYFIQLKAGNYRQTIKAVLLK